METKIDSGESQVNCSAVKAGWLPVSSHSTPTHTATAESTKALTGLVTVNNANKIATRLVYDTLRVELVWANRIEGAPMPRHQITPALR